MKKNIYFVRHGETDCNSQNLIQGRGIDAPLNSKGHLQADAFYQHYKNVPFSKIYTSTLQRTHQSMAPFIQSGIPHQILAGFDEMNFGEMEGKSMFDANGNFTLEWLLSKWREGDTEAKAPGGESPKEVLQRILEALKEVISHESEENVIICMHGRALRVIVSHLLGKTMANMEHIFHHNLSLSLFEYDYSSGIYTPIRLADHSHLKEVGKAPAK